MNALASANVLPADQIQKVQTLLAACARTFENVQGQNILSADSQTMGSRRTGNPQSTFPAQHHAVLAPATSIHPIDAPNF